LFTEELVAEFPHFDRYEDSRKCFCADFANLGAEAASRQFAQAEDVLESLLMSAEHINLALYVTLSDAKSRVGEAQAVADKHAVGSGTCA
jgi:hypothetical protein